MGDSTLSDELVRAVALAIAQAIVDQKGSGATFDVGSMTIIDAGSNHGWEVLPVAKAALKVVQPTDGTPQSHVDEPRQ